MSYEKGKRPYAIDKVRPGNEWALTDGFATRKYDGTSVTIIKGKLFRRFDKKKGGKLPEGSIECQPADETTGHHPHWIPCSVENHHDKYHFESFNEKKKWNDGTYELCGPKIRKKDFGFKR